MRNLLPILIAVGVASHAPSAGAADFYVSALAGSDANDGTSPAQAWRTITHALAQLGASADTLHVLAGSYTSSTGEVWPLQPHGQTIVGEAELGATVIDGEGFFQPLFSLYFTPTAQALSPRIADLTLRNAGTGVAVRSTWSEVVTTLERLDVRGCVHGVDAFSGPSFGAGRYVVTLNDVHVEGCTRAVVGGTSNSGASTILLDRCVLRGSLDDAIQLASSGSTGGVTCTARRTRIEGSLGHGAHLFTNVAGPNANFEDCLIAQNLAGGYRSELGMGASHGVFRRTTVADCGSTGIYSGQRGAYFHGVRIESSIVAGHAQDIDSNAIEALTDSLVGIDPSFVDRVNGDYRLRFGSAAIDIGATSTPLGALDLAGTARPIDGDMNTQERADAGALEFQPLALFTSASIGTPLRLEVAGETGGSATIYFTRGPLVPPASTSYGDFDLNPATYGTLLTLATARFPPSFFQRPIPNDPLLIGRTFAFQSLSTSSAAPLGLAYTNAVQVTIQP